MKALENIDRLQISNETLINLLVVYESKGKEFYYDDLFERDISSFNKNNVEENLFFLCKIMDINVSEHRIKMATKRDFIPKNKDEKILQGLFIVLFRIQTSSDRFDLITNEITDLAKTIFSQQSILFNTYESNMPGMIKKNISKREDLDKLIELFDKKLKKNETELINLVVNFYVDFINLNIFNNENDRIGLIIMYVLLAKNFSVFKYISLFKLFYAKKELWNKGILEANYYWATGFAKTDTLTLLLIDMVLSAYNEINSLAHEYKFEIQLNKSDNIENTILKLDEIFTKEDIRKKHPTVSDTTIDRTLKRLRDEDKIRPLSKGRSSKWQRIVDSNKKDYDKQVTLFNFEDQ